MELPERVWSYCGVVIADAPDYRANPARLAEQVAIPIVGRWLGGSGKLHDESASDARFDFIIEYADDRRGVGDVWLDADETLTATWSDLFKQPRHHEIELSRGVGTWSLGLTNHAIGKVLRRELPSLVDDALSIAHTHLDLELWWDPPGTDAAIRSVYDKGRALCIAYLTRQDSEGPDVAIYLPMSSPKVRATDPGTLRGWIGDVFAKPAGMKHVDKLLSANADERHAFVVAYNATPQTVEAILENLTVAEPALVVPDGITHVWVLPRRIEAMAAVWTQAQDWRLIER